MEGLNAGHNHGQATNGATSAQPNAVALGSDTSGVAETNGTPSKDEVGWYFVEQYYTTLSKSPEKLHVCRIPTSPSPMEALCNWINC
jgi:hypothetical protein